MVAALVCSYGYEWLYFCSKINKYLFVHVVIEVVRCLVDVVVVGCLVVVVVVVGVGCLVVAVVVVVDVVVTIVVVVVDDDGGGCDSPTALLVSVSLWW
jgi:hypothetical protein